MPPMSLLMWLIAVLPIFLLFSMLLFFRTPLVKAAGVCLVLVALTASLAYKAPLALLQMEVIKAIWSSLPIAIVIFSALLMYEVSQSINAFQVIQREITRLIPDKLLQVLTVGWCFTAFLQGPSGFGVPIAVVAPLLVGIGVRPLWAVIIPLIAQSWGSTFGTLALAFNALIEQTSIVHELYSPTYFETALWSAIFIGILCFSSGWVIAWFYGSWKAVKHAAVAVSILGAVQALGQILLSQINPTLSAFIPASLAFVLAFFLAKLPQYKGHVQIKSTILKDTVEAETYFQKEVSVFLAGLPYLLLVLISLGILLTPSIHSALSSFTFSLSFPAATTGYGVHIPAVDRFSPIALFLQPGFFILLASLLTLIVYCKKNIFPLSKIKQITKNTVKRSIPTSIAVVFLITFSRIMNASGEILVLAEGTAFITGEYYSLFAPLIGGIGAFISGSNVSSNILFANFQESIAKVLAIKTPIILAAQTSGGATGALIDPAKILLGATTVNVSGREGEILRKLLKYFLAIIVLLGILTFYYK